MARFSQGCDEAVGVADRLGVDGDDTRAVILDQCAHEIGDAERRLVAATDGDADAEAEILRAACAFTAMPPLWLMIETLPGVKRSISVINELNDAVRPMDVLMMPMQLGPHSFSELARHNSVSCRCLARPSSLPSAKPPAHTTADGTPAAMQSRATSCTDSAGKAMIAMSGIDGRSARLGKHGSSATVVRPAFTGHTEP
jgi:hypothetical protein